MQMGRWFGYRPNYDDLVKIWLSTDAIDWYGKVVDANPFHIEAYQERMDIRKATGDEAGAEEDRTKLAELRYNRPLAPGEGGIEKKVKDAYDSINPLGL